LSKEHPLMPKGKACRLDLSDEYVEGKNAPYRSTNPYDFWDEYVKYYSWDIGNQKGR